MDANTILDSKSLKAAALFIGIVSGLIKITGVLSQTIASTIASLCFAIAIFYFAALLLQWLGNRFITALSKNLAQNLIKYEHDHIQNNTKLPEEEKGKKPDLLITDNYRDAKGSYYYSAKRYGIGYASMDITFDIDKDGSAIVTRTIDIEAFSEVKTLDTYLLIPEKSIGGNKRDIEPIQVKSQTPNWSVELDALQKNDKVQQSSVLMTISPPLQPGDKFKYEMIERLPSKLYAIDLTREELNSRENPFDYAGWNISRPSKKLSLKVVFPENFQPAIFAAEVRYATASGFPSTRIQHEEQKKLKPKMSAAGVKNFYIFSLEVEYPMTGLIYILRWKPIPNTSDQDE